MKTNKRTDKDSRLLDGAGLGTFLIRILFTFENSFEKSFQPLLTLLWGVCFKDQLLALPLGINYSEMAIFLLAMFKCDVHKQNKFRFYLKKNDGIKSKLLNNFTTVVLKIEEEQLLIESSKKVHDCIIYKFCIRIPIHSHPFQTNNLNLQEQ